MWRQSAAAFPAAQVPPPVLRHLRRAAAPPPARPIEQVLGEQQHPVLAEQLYHWMRVTGRANEHRCWRQQSGRHACFGQRPGRVSPWCPRHALLCALPGRRNRERAAQAPACPLSVHPGRLPRPAVHLSIALAHSEQSPMFVTSLMPCLPRCWAPHEAWRARSLCDNPVPLVLPTRAALSSCARRAARRGSPGAPSTRGAPRGACRRRATSSAATRVSRGPVALAWLGHALL